MRETATGTNLVLENMMMIKYPLESRKSLYLVFSIFLYLYIYMEELYMDFENLNYYQKYMFLGCLNSIAIYTPWSICLSLTI